MNSQMHSRIVLTLIGGPSKGKVFTFTEPDNFLLGREDPDSNAHFRLSPDDTFVSRNHFFLEINPPDCYLRDAGSLNGTYVIRQAGERVVFFLEGRTSIEWLGPAKNLAELFKCESCQDVEERLKLKDGDFIQVGATLIEVKIYNELLKTPGDRPQERGFYCVRCGKNVKGRKLEKDAEDLASDDFLCDECLTKAKAKGSFKKGIVCNQCQKDLTELADTDGRAEELKDTALYWCERCMSGKKRAVPVSRVGDYQIVKELGEGGFGVVYLGWHEKTGRIVAIKLTRERIKTDKELLKRFKREIAIMKELAHPHLVRLYDDGVSKEKNYYFVSEYLSEGSLADLFFKRYQGRMSYKDACFFMCQAMEGLSYFHNKGYVHRDLKPENILIKREVAGGLVAKVGDFGLARNYAFHGGTITRGREWIGTLFYSPPEQILDFKNSRPCTDVYAIGMSLYFLLTGEYPYDFPTREKFLELVAKGEKPRDPLSLILGDDKPQPIERKRSDLPSQLAKAINRSIEKDSSKRFDSVEKFKKAIERYSG